MTTAQEWQFRISNRGKFVITKKGYFMGFCSTNGDPIWFYHASHRSLETYNTKEQAQQEIDNYFLTGPFTNAKIIQL